MIEQYGFVLCFFYTCAYIWRMVKTLLMQNIEFLRRRNGISRNALAVKAGMHQPTLQRILSGESADPRTSSLQPLADYFEVSVSDLRSKNFEAEFQKEMRESDRASFIGEEDAALRLEAAGAVRFITFDHLTNVRVSAGPGAEPVSIQILDAVDHVQVMADWAREKLGTHDTDRVKLVTCKGDSMLPTIHPGDVVFVDVYRSAYDGDGIYVILLDKHLLIKRLRMQLDKRLAVISDNSALYPPEILEGSAIKDLQICGRALAWWTIKKS